MEKDKWTDAIKNLDKDSDILKGSENEKKESLSENREIYLIDENKPNNVIRKFDKEVKTDDIDMPNEFVDLLIGKRKGKNPAKVSLLDMPIAATNILFRSIALVKASQFSTKARPLQLQLFEEEFKTKENAKVSMVINIKDISASISADGKVKGRREKVREAIDFLQQNLFVWVTSKNSKGEQTDYKLSYIESPSFTKGKVYFEMNVFWLEQLMNLKVYNTILFQLPKLLGSTRHVLFSIYLERFELNQWKLWNYKNINELFGLKYSDANSLAKTFLRELRFKLDKNSLRSFQYKVDGDNIHIMPYEMKKIVGNTSVKLEKETLEKLEDNYFSNYLGRRHDLSKEKKQSILDVLKSSKSDKIILTTAYTELKRDCRKNKVSVADLKGEHFLNKYNNFIYQEYLKSERFKKFPNGYPRI